MVTEPGARTIIQSDLVIFANPNSGTEIQEEILQEASGAELGAQDWEQSSTTCAHSHPGQDHTRGFSSHGEPQIPELYKTS